MGPRGTVRIPRAFHSPTRRSTPRAWYVRHCIGTASLVIHTTCLERSTNRQPSMHFEPTVGSECVKTDVVAGINKEPGVSSLPCRKAGAMREVKQCNFTMVPRGYFFLLTFGIQYMLVDVELLVWHYNAANRTFALPFAPLILRCSWFAYLFLQFFRQGFP